MVKRCKNYMDLKIKLLEFAKGWHYLIVIAQGEIHSQALKRIFNEIEKTIRPLVSCKVFIDLEEAALNIGPAAIHSIADQVELPTKNNPIKMAVVAPKFDRCGRLHLLCDLLSRRGLRVAVFDNTTSAAAWLSEEM